MSLHQPTPPSAPAVTPGTVAAGTWATRARETLSPAADEACQRHTTARRKSDSTFVGEVHGKRGAYVDARDEALVSELGHFEEGLEEDVAREEPDAGTVHDQEGVSFAAFELPLSFEGCVRDACDAAATTSYVGMRSNGQIAIGCGPTLLVPGARPPVLRPWRR